MGEVLSQSEIDSLLAALSSGELDVEEMQEKDERQVKNYDFSRQNYEFKKTAGHVPGGISPPAGD